ncbi:MAG: hypothetical protein R6V16_11395 [Bacteroidales bacterium]
MIDNLKFKLLNSPEWIISIGVFLVYWLVSKSYTGPSVLNDEIGYLANAALISGHIIDGAFSYHAGYSFFLAPLFIIFSEPSHIWQAAMVLNAFIWAVSFLLLAFILKALVPEFSKGQLFIALLISAVYPTWITMSGYVFTTTAFVFVYLLAVLTFLLWKPDKFWTIVPHCLAVGYLYWIHPIGLAVCVASLIVVGFVSLKEKSYASTLLNIVLLVVLIIIYREVVDKWLVMLATPEDHVPLYRHYPASERIIGRLFNYDFWLEAAAKAAGQISYLIVSSFGLALFGFIACINKSYPLIERVNKDNDNGYNLVFYSTYAFLALSLLGVLAMGVMFFSVGGSTRIDQWIYGRYTEMVVLPLLALGYLSSWNKKGLIFAALFIISTGLLLNQIVDTEVINLNITTVAFWPQYVILESNYLYWMVAGALAVLLLGWVRNHNKLAHLLTLAIVLTVFVLSTAIQTYVHHDRISAHGKPSAFVEIIRENYPPGTCVGVNPEEFGDFRNDPQRQKYHLHLFHLYDYTYRRMSPEEWLNSCNGPYLSYSLDGLDAQQGVNIVGEEVHSNLYLLVKDDDLNIVIPKSTNSIRFTDDGWLKDKD